MQEPLHIQIKAWTPATPIRLSDNLIASKYAKTRPFVPSYERDRRPCIELLLSNEYQRIWWRERNVWEKGLAQKSRVRKIMPRIVIKKKGPVLAKTLPKKPHTIKFKLPEKKLQKKKAIKEREKIKEEKKEKRIDYA